MTLKSAAFAPDNVTVPTVNEAVPRFWMVKVASPFHWYLRCFEVGMVRAARVVSPSVTVVPLPRTLISGPATVPPLRREHRTWNHLARRGGQFARLGPAHRKVVSTAAFLLQRLHMIRADLRPNGWRPTFGWNSYPTHAITCSRGPRRY